MGGKVCNPTGTGLVAGIADGFNPAVMGLFNGGVISESYSRGTVVSQDYTGSFQFVGPLAIIPVSMMLSVGDQYGYTDFSNTAAFSFDTLPAGVSYTTASGDFFASEAAAVPEPTSLLLLGTGLLALVVIRRRGPMSRPGALPQSYAS